MINKYIILTTVIVYGLYYRGFIVSGYTVLHKRLFDDCRSSFIIGTHVTSGFVNPVGINRSMLSSKVIPLINRYIFQVEPF